MLCARERERERRERSGDRGGREAHAAMGAAPVACCCCWNCPWRCTICERPGGGFSSCARGRAVTRLVPVEQWRFPRSAESGRRRTSMRLVSTFVSRSLRLASTRVLRHERTRSAQEGSAAKRVRSPPPRAQQDAHLARDPLEALVDVVAGFRLVLLHKDRADELEDVVLVGQVGELLRARVGQRRRRGEGTVRRGATFFTPSFSVF